MNNNPEYNASDVTVPDLSQANALIPSGLLGGNCAYGAKSFYLLLSMESMDWLTLRVVYAMASFLQDPCLEAYRLIPGISKRCVSTLQSSDITSHILVLFSSHQFRGKVGTLLNIRGTYGASVASGHEDAFLSCLKIQQ